MIVYFYISLRLESRPTVGFFFFILTFEFFFFFFFFLGGGGEVNTVHVVTFLCE